MTKRHELESEPSHQARRKRLPFGNHPFLFFTHILPPGKSE